MKHLQIVSGSADVTFTSPNKFSFKMPNNYISGSHHRVSLKSLVVYYSWFNVTAAKQNNVFSYIWSNGTTYQVVLDDGTWSYTDFQAYLHQVMKMNNHYLIDPTGKDQFFISIAANSVFYRISLSITPVPASLPANWTAPAGFVFPAVATTPSLIVPATEIQSYLGFNAGTYPSVPQSGLYQVNGTSAPQVTSSSSLMIMSNLAYNEYAPNQATVATFNLIPGTAPGSLISVVPFYQDWIPVQPNKSFQYIDLFLVDQLSRPVKIEDPSGFICTITLDTGTN